MNLELFCSSVVIEIVSHSIKLHAIENMEKRFEGFLAPNGLYILDTHTGEVRFIAHDTNVTIAASASVPVGNLSFGLNIPQQANKFSPFENEVISSYPYLIAKPFSDLLKETDARMKCKLMVDTFTAVLKYLALQLASEYIRAKDLKDLQIHQTLTKDLSRPLISSWNLLIARCLPVMKDNRVELFSPEMKVAYEKLESKCKDPFLVTQNYSDENGEIKTKIKKLGKIQALINYRNGLAHGFNQSQTRAQKEFDEYYPLLCDILQEVRFVSRYTLWHVESSRQGVNGIRLMGANPSMKKVDFDREGVNPAISPLFLINDASGEILPMYAFFDVDDANETGLPEIGKDVFVFEGNTKNTIIYLSSSGEHLEKTSRFQHWKDLLAQKQLEVEWADAKNLSLDVLHTIGNHISSSGIQSLISSAKYLREATVPRQDLNELLYSFSDSIFNGFILGGESGIGKSTLLAQKTEEWQKEGHMVSFYRGSALNQNDIGNKFLRDCALKVSYPEDFLSLVNPLFVESGKKCYLIVDALNEYSGDLNELIKATDNLVAQAANYPWFKVIVSIRDSAYNRATSRFGQSTMCKYYTVEEEKCGEKVKTNIIRLQPIANDFVEQLYNAYRSYKWKDSSDPDVEGYYKFRPLTAFSELDPKGTTVQLIRSPLMARLVMQSFHRAKLPQQLNNDDAMRLYYNNIVVEKTDESPGFPERRKFLSLLVVELDKIAGERIDRDTLIQLDSMRSYLINNQRDSAYIQLLDLGILMEEWESDNCYVRFAFDKFFEFLLAELHWPRINDTESLMALCKRAATFKILQGTIEIILIRFCLNNQSQQLVELIDLADTASDEMKTLIKDTAVRLLFALGNEYKAVFNTVIEAFPKQPGAMDLQILQELLDKLFLTGQLEEFEKTLKIATQEAELLDDRKVLSDLFLSAAELDILQGRYLEARIKLNSVIEIKTELQDEYGRLIGYKMLGKIEWREGNTENALRIFESALSDSKRLSFLNLTSTFQNNLAVLYELKGEMQKAEKLYLKSLDIRRQHGDNSGISMSLNNLGSFYKNQGKIQEAEKLYLESLEIKRQLGDKSGISTSLNSLGILYKDQGKMQEAEKLYLESLEIRRQLDNKSGISASLNNLGVLYKDQGKMQKAENLFLESLEIKRQLGEKSGISMSLNNLAVLYYEHGNNTSAIEYFTESIELKRALGAVSNLVGTIHRVYSLLDKRRQHAYNKELDELDKREFTAKEHCWLTNIQLINNCMHNVSIDVAEIKKIIEQIIDYTQQITISDIDDLPVEAFYVASKKLIQLNAAEEAQELAKQALKWIGDRKTRRKEDLERMINSTANNSM